MPEFSTPRPWKATEHGHATTVRADDSSMPKPIAEIWDNGDSRAANAELIVSAVNAHADLVEALENLRKSAALLQQNALGCAVNHCGEDFELHGLPGWLVDTQADIDAAHAALEKAGRTI